MGIIKSLGIRLRIFVESLRGKRLSATEQGRVAGTLVEQGRQELLKVTEEDPAGYSAAEPLVTTPMEVAGSYLRKGKAAFMEGYFEEAENYYKQAVAASYSYAILLSTGNFYKDAGKYAEAERYYNEALDNLNRSSKPDDQSGSMILLSMALLYNKMEDHRKAVEYYKEALELYSSIEIKNPDTYNDTLAFILSNLAHTYSVVSG